MIPLTSSANVSMNKKRLIIAFFIQAPLSSSVKSKTSIPA